MALENKLDKQDLRFVADFLSENAQAFYSFLRMDNAEDEGDRIIDAILFEANT